MANAATIRSGTARAFTIPTDAPEADGTLAWNSTTLVVVELQAGDVSGIGYTYAHRASVIVVRELIDKHCIGHDPFNINALFAEMKKSQRNYGAEGMGATALSAVDIALWDLKARLLEQPLACLLGLVRRSAPVYGSGGFTSYPDSQLNQQLSGWVEQGIPAVKMKVGTHPDQDSHRMAIARKAIGDGTRLFIDANGAYSRKQSLYFAKLAHQAHNVTWCEEPVSSDDLEGLRFVRDRAPSGMDIAAGEYGWSSMYLARMIASQAVDVIQADATRCGGVTGFMDAAAIAHAHPLPLSAHCAPTIHMHLACAAPTLRHVEYFHDHVRIESMLFDGFRAAQSDGCMHPDFMRPGLGIEFKQKDAEAFAEESLITERTFILLKTGWGDKRGNSKEFLTAWPYMSGSGAQYLLNREVKGMGIDGLSTGGYPGEHAETDAHKLLLGAHKLLLEDIYIPDALLDGKRRHFAAFPILIANAGGAWTRPIVWDTGDLDSDSRAPECTTKLPTSIASAIELQRGAA